MFLFIAVIKGHVISILRILVCSAYGIIFVFFAPCYTLYVQFVCSNIDIFI